MNFNITKANACKILAAVARRAGYDFYRIEPYWNDAHHKILMFYNEKEHVLGSELLISEDGTLHTLLFDMHDDERPIIRFMMKNKCNLYAAEGESKCNDPSLIHSHPWIRLFKDADTIEQILINCELSDI